MFVCYGATIEEQFEFLNRRWANSPIQPNSGGHDPTIGQADEGGSRDRHIDFPTKDGSRRIPFPGIGLFRQAAGTSFRRQFRRSRMYLERDS